MKLIDAIIPREPRNTLAGLFVFKSVTNDIIKELAISIINVTTQIKRDQPITLRTILILLD
jgi:hypothetical protein